jgi:hypothetical protein
MSAALLADGIDDPPNVRLAVRFRSGRSLADFRCNSLASHLSTSAPINTSTYSHTPHSDCPLAATELEEKAGDTVGEDEFRGKEAGSGGERK